MKKRIAVIVAAVLLAAVAVGTTLAFLVDRTPSVKNKFRPVFVSCLVLETFDAQTNVKSNVSVQNTGDIPAYVRAALVVTWVSQESGNTYGGAPVAGTDYTVTMGQSGWLQGSDGFYYCQSAVAAGGTTPLLVSAITPVAGRAPQGYVLSVQIVASAIQAEPAEVVSAAWNGVTVQSNGTISPQ